MNPRVVVAQLGARQDYTVPIALQRSGVLERFYTDAYLSDGEARLIQGLRLNHRIKRPVQSVLSRNTPALHGKTITRFNGLGLRYYRSLRRQNSINEQYRAFIEYGRRFNQAILRAGLPASTHVYAFDHAALDLFHSPEIKEQKKILDQIYPALFEEKLEAEEECKWQGWARVPRAKFYESAVFAEWRDIQITEWELADTIIVASKYSHDSVASVAPAIRAKLKTVSLTVDLDAYKPYQHIRELKSRRPLRALFAGTVNLRKGLPYLLEAFSKIDPNTAKLTVVGPIQLSEKKIAEHQDRIDFLGPVPHVEMRQIYSDADVFVFPTISDGFGAVMLEAMGTGLPVVATNHCADIVENGVNGLQIPIRCADSIREAIVQIANDPNLLQHLSRGAIAASEHFTLERYREKLCQALGV